MQRLLDVPPSKGEVIVTVFPHFVEAVAAPARGTMSAEMSFKSPEEARQWGERQARRLGFLSISRGLMSASGGPV